MSGNKWRLRRETAAVAATPLEKFRLTSTTGVTLLPKLTVLQIGVTFQRCCLPVDSRLKPIVV